MRHTSDCNLHRHPEASALAVAALSLLWFASCGSSDRQEAPAAHVGQKAESNSATEESTPRSPSGASASVAKAAVLTTEQIQEQERSVDQLVAAENSQLPKRLERAVDKLRLEALGESGDGYKHAESVQALVFSGQGVSAANLEGWRGVFQRPSSKVAFDQLLAVLRTHEDTLQEFNLRRPSAQIQLQWNEIAARLNSEVDRFKDIRGRCLLPATVTSLRDGRVQTLSRVVAAPPDELTGLKAGLESTRKDLAAFATQAANFHKFPDDATDALATVGGILADLNLIPGQAGRQEAWNVLAERWNTVATGLNAALDRSLALRQEPEFPPRALRTTQDLLAWLDGIEIVDRDRSSRASALQQDVRASATALAGHAGSSSFDALGSAAHDVRQAVDDDLEALERVRTIDRSKTVAYHRSVVQSLPSDLQALDALTRFGSEVRARKLADPIHWSRDAWFTAYSDLQDAAFGAIMVGPIGERADATARRWTTVTTAKGWPTLLRSWTRSSVLGPEEQRGFEASLQEWKAAARSFDAKEAAALATYLREEPLTVGVAEQRASWPSVLAAVAAEHRLFDLPPGCIEPVNAQLAARVAGFTSPADSYHAELVERFNRNRDILDASGMKAIMREERARKPEMWTDNDKVYALYADLQDLQLRAYFKVSLSKVLPNVIDSYVNRTLPGKMPKFKEAARSLRLADAQGMLALIAGEAIDLARLKDWMQASMGYPQVSIASPDLWQALVQELGDTGQ